MSVYKGAFRYAAVLLLAALFSYPFSLGLSCIFGGLMLFVIYFFRMPTRLPLIDESNLVSPAWGKVTSIDRDEADGRMRISIFLSIFDVHLQCAPCSGRVEEITYQKGQFLNAMRSDSADLNEKNTIRISHPVLGSITVSQIAGLIARRIICFVSKSEAITAGSYFGLIQFGSRVEITIPQDFDIMIRIGQRVCGRHTVIARKKQTEQKNG